MPVTYEEMNQARSVFGDARKEFNLKYHDFLITVLKEAGVYKKLVKIKDKDLTGQFKIDADPYDRQPWTIKFYPLTKNGEISLRSKYLNNFYSWKENELVEQLLKIAEVVGDLP